MIINACSISSIRDNSKYNALISLLLMVALPDCFDCKSFLCAAKKSFALSLKHVSEVFLTK